MRLFIAIDFNEYAEYFQRLQKHLPKAKQTFPKDFHLTLKFLGEVDEKEVDKVKEKLSEIKFSEFSCDIEKLGNFGGRTIKVVFVRITESKKLIELQKQIDEKLSDMFKKEKNFDAHLTLSRIKEVENRKRYLMELNKIQTGRVSKKVKSFELIKSTLTPEGPVYEVLGSFKADT